MRLLRGSGIVMVWSEFSLDAHLSILMEDISKIPCGLMLEMSFDTEIQVP